MAFILLLDKDIDSRSRLAGELVARGHVVEERTPRAVGLVLAELLRQTHGRPDILVVDPFVAGVDTATLTRLLRVGSRCPLLVVSDPRPEPVVVRLFNEGVDGFLPKPVSGAMLDARIGAILRRVPARPMPRSSVIGGLRLDVAAREASLAGNRLRLTRLEFDLLAMLAESPGRLVTRKALLTRLSGSRRPNKVEVLLSRLRSKLGESADHPRYLHVKRGRGVALLSPPSY